MNTLWKFSVDLCNATGEVSLISAINKITHLYAFAFASGIDSVKFMWVSIVIGDFISPSTRMFSLFIKCTGQKYWAFMIVFMTGPQRPECRSLNTSLGHAKTMDKSKFIVDGDIIAI